MRRNRCQTLYWCHPCRPGFSIALIWFNLGAIPIGSPAQTAPYPPSTVIRALQWHWDTYQAAAVGSDLWPITWGPDDNLYAAWGDGGGFGGSDSDGRGSLGFAGIVGDP